MDKNKKECTGKSKKQSWIVSSEKVEGKNMFDVEVKTDSGEIKRARFVPLRLI